jgi:hypothetical protein
MTFATPAAGWYPDPYGPGLLRWWDGARWTEHTSPVPIGAPPVMAVPPGVPGAPRPVSSFAPANPWALTPAAPAATVVDDARRPFAVLGLIAGISLVIGSFLPWVRVEIFGSSLGRSGIDGGDGWFTLVCGGVAITAFALVLHDGRRAHRAIALTSLLAAMVAASVAIYDWIDVHDAVSTAQDTQGLVSGHVGIGLHLAVIAAVLALVSGLACLLRGPARPASTT